MWRGGCMIWGSTGPSFRRCCAAGDRKGELTRHKQFGAAAAHGAKRLDACFAILGHHGGIPDKTDVKNALDSLDREVLTHAIQASRAEMGAIPSIEALVSADPNSFDLAVRLLFSCLVDADWLDTGRHEASTLGMEPPPIPPALDADKRLAVLLDFVRARSAGCVNRALASVRNQILHACMQGADLPPGLFSLTVPTGGGKTLSSLAFALKHAEEYGLRRIIYVSPYLSIIEQNAKVIAESLDAETGAVLEHHSLAEPSGDNEASSAADRLAENWDAPLVLTTSVQFYESLFTNQPRRCRKLHNIARSVVILDECQTLPPGLTAPTTQMLQQACEYLGCTMVLCTATQPAWERDEKVLKEGLSGVREIVPPELELFSRLRRVRVQWPRRDTPDWKWSDVAERMADTTQALCVVNAKKSARELYLELNRSTSGAFHLSTTMCPAHRLMVLEKIRWRLKEGIECRVISTQLIEAGVDVDFPVVLRELAPLEGIVQAAGRCNREGLLPDAGGQVIVFRSVDGGMPRDGWYRNGRDVVQQDFLNAGREPDIGEPLPHLREYYHRLYHTGDVDQKQLCAVRRQLQFRALSDGYQLIEEQGTTAVVPLSWEPGAQAIGQLLDELRRCPSRAAYRRLGQICRQPVSLGCPPA